MLGVMLQLAGGGLIRSELFGVSPWDPAAVMLAIMVLCLVGAVAVWIPARRAARVDPMVALRCE
jgi:ABC-type antimicrobial peptide transport system permease subunit